MAAKTNPKRMLLASVSRPGPDSLTITFAFLVLASTLAGLSSRAEGLRSIVPGAYGLDRAGGRFAQIEDSSANWHNPANLIYLTNAEFQLAPSVVRIEVDYTSPTGSETETQNPWKLAPSAYGAMSFNDGKYALGLGVTMPYGLSVDWDSQSPLTTPFYYTAPFFSQLTTVNVNPNVAMRITDNLSVAVGLDVMWSQLEIKRNYSWAPFGATPLVDDGVAELNGDG